MIVTPEAEKELKGYIAYLRSVKKNPQAVRNVLNDFKDTKTSLGNVAGSLKGRSPRRGPRRFRQGHPGRHDAGVL